MTELTRIGAVVVAMSRGEITPAKAQVRLVSAGLPHPKALALVESAARNLKVPDV
jgi:hypothetical protein